MSLTETFVLGTVQLGMKYGINNSIGELCLEKGLELLNAAYDRGIRKFDTALGYGKSHQVFSEFQKKDIKIYSKIALDAENSFSLNWEKCLISLKVQNIFALSLHNFKSLKFFTEKDKAIVLKLKNENAIKSFGISVLTPAEAITALQNEAIDFIQMPFNLLDNWERRKEVWSLAKKLNKKVQIRSIFLQGLIVKDPNNLTGNLQAFINPLQEIRSIASHNQLTTEQLGIDYALSFPWDEWVVGLETVEQLEHNLKYFKNHKDISESLKTSIHKLKLADESLLNPSTWKVEG